MTKHRVTFVHKISNPRDMNGHLLYEVLNLDMGAIKAALPAEDSASKVTVRIAKVLREQDVLLSGARVREVRRDGDLLLVFPTLPGTATYHHCVMIQLTETYDT
jgi:hypothetical protein